MSETPVSNETAAWARNSGEGYGNGASCRIRVESTCKISCLIRFPIALNEPSEPSVIESVRIIEYEAVTGAVSVSRIDVSPKN